MNIREFYQTVGGDYDKVLARLPLESMIVRFVRKFPADTAYGDLKQAQNARDPKQAFRAVHTLKGVAATLGFQNLTAAASALTEQLRPQVSFPNESFFFAVDETYRQVVDAIAELPDNLQ